VNWYSSDLSLHFLNNTIWFRNKQEKISESDVRHGIGFDHPLPSVYITGDWILTDCHLAEIHNRIWVVRYATEDPLRCRCATQPNPQFIPLIRCCRPYRVELQLWHSLLSRLSSCRNQLGCMMFLCVWSTILIFNGLEYKLYKLCFEYYVVIFPHIRFFLVRTIYLHVGQGNGLKGSWQCNARAFS
jgi:hypothetical protein